MDETDVVGHIHPRSEPRHLVYIQFTIVRYTSTYNIIVSDSFFFFLFVYYKITYFVFFDFHYYVFDR